MAIAATTEIYLQGGPARVNELKGSSLVQVWDGTSFPPARVQAGKIRHKLYKIILKSRLYLDITTDHRVLAMDSGKARWVQVRELKAGFPLLVAALPQERSAGVSGIKFDPVVSVVQLELGDVYDLEILSAQRMFVANKIFVHSA